MLALVIPVTSSATWTKASVLDENQENQELSVDPDHKWERQIWVLNSLKPQMN